MSDLVDAARALAHRWLDDPTLPLDEIARRLESPAPRARLSDCIAALQQDACVALDRTPREAVAYARVAHELARAGAAAQADAALTLAIALNRLGEFRDARALCEFAVSEFTARGDDDNLSRALCEAAWADTFIGDLSQASARTERARALTLSPLLHARCDWVYARVLRDQAHYPEAAILFEKIRDVFRLADLPLEAARCERELAETNVWSDRDKAFALLEPARQTFQLAECILDAAICDLVFTIGLSETSRHLEAQSSILSTREQFTRLHAHFFAAWCDQVSGISCRHLNRFGESLQAFHQARNYYLSHAIRKDISACDINLGNTYYMLNRYDEALALYKEAAALSLADGREARVARIYTNMGLVYAKQGSFSEALDLHHRALAIAVAKGLTVLAASNHADLAACYRQLGQYDEALAHLQEREKLAPPISGERFAARRIDLAALYFAHGEISKAVTCLEQARSTAVADNLDSLVAVCDRLLAQASAQTADREHALALTQNARRLFLKHSQTVDAALCDLTEGELRLQWNEVALAQDYFQRARAILAPAFPDQAWRTDYGLGHCAASSGDPAGALVHYLHAARTIAASRSMLVTEQLSNDFFAYRQSVFDDALSLAQQQDAAESALEIIEASKARAFLTLLRNRDWKLRDDHGDPHVADLIARERELRYQLATLHRRVAVQAGQEDGEPLRGGKTSAGGAALQELIALSQVYEAVVTQLRLATAGLAGVSAPAPFALQKFRDVADAAFGSDWTALDYYLAGDTLTRVMVDPDSVSVERQTLSAYDRAILAKCTSAEPELRELIYRGTLHGTTVPSPGNHYLKHLYRLLIPRKRGTALIVSPHGALHAMPFHALVDPSSGAFLIEQHPLVYAPNLQALQLLLNEPMDGAVKQPLVVGISDFGDRMRPLPAAAVEADIVRQAFGGCGEFLRNEQATRQRLLELDVAGELQKFDVLHFATHAVLDSAASCQSRVLLSDDVLTVTDILDLSLNARLVMLSACETGLGQNGRGDELIGLARAFFYAGARAVLVTLWRVEDRGNTELTKQFYRNLTRGASVADALCKAQVEMIRAGCPPYHWAPFVFMGQP